MSKGPKGEKRPADVISGAVRVMRIATGEKTPDEEKDPAVVEMGKKGGSARVKNLTPEQRSAIAKKAARARW